MPNMVFLSNITNCDFNLWKLQSSQQVRFRNMIIARRSLPIVSFVLLTYHVPVPWKRLTAAVTYLFIYSFIIHLFIYLFIIDLFAHLLCKFFHSSICLFISVNNSQNKKQSIKIPLGLKNKILQNIKIWNIRMSPKRAIPPEERL